MKRYSKKGLEKRKSERQGFTEFFQKHIEVARNSYCEECGQRLTGDVSEVAHCLPKSYFKSISVNDNNILYLCGRFSTNNCHSLYDNSAIEKVKEMKIYPKIKEIFQQLKPEITESINYKVYEKYED